MGTFNDEILISDFVYRPTSIFSIDINGDGYLDILSSSSYDNKIAWYENLDGLGNFSSQKVINTNAIGATSVYAVDIDGDNDIDVISSSQTDDKVAWYENLDGLGTFSIQKIIDITQEHVHTISAFDYEDDGDIDILSSAKKCKNTLFKNIDGLGNFSKHELTSSSFTSNNHANMIAADIDNDGDIDILKTVECANPSISWKENTGSGNYINHNLSAMLNTGISSIFIEDLNNDTNLDVIFTYYKNSYKIVWIENITDYTNRIYHTLNTNNKPSNSISTDIDNDGDNDIIYIESSENRRIMYFENIDGNGNFSSEQILIDILDYPTDIYAIDINQDGKIDVISTSNTDNKISWFKNQGVLNVNGSTNLIFYIYPVPTENILNINSKTKITKIEIYSKLGQLILKNSTKNQIDISNLTQGLYFVKVEDVNGNFGMKKILKR